MPTPQSFKSHTRWDPLMHFFIFPVLILNFLVSCYFCYHHYSAHPHICPWLVFMSLVLILLAAKVRLYALKVQDRVIRLEERLRLAAILPASDQAHIHELQVAQLIALRFASDGELPGLVHRTLTQNLEPKAIKESITNWRADNHRV